MRPGQKVNLGTERKEVVMTDRQTHDDRTSTQTAQAELANYRKRAERDLAQQHQHEREAILRDWLPVVDNLERALAHRDSATLEHLWDGLEAVRQQALDILGHNGVSCMQTIGTRFDPVQHNCGLARARCSRGRDPRRSPSGVSHW
jgi:molecular chaperone GrpE